MLNAYLKYLSIICHGKKSEIVIYKKSIEGCGKSTETEFLINYVFGRDICLISGIEPLTTCISRLTIGKKYQRKASKKASKKARKGGSIKRKSSTKASKRKSSKRNST
jgi:hypothetical protein